MFSRRPQIITRYYEVNKDGLPLRRPCQNWTDWNLRPLCEWRRQRRSTVNFVQSRTRLHPIGPQFQVVGYDWLKNSKAHALGRPHDHMFVKWRVFNPLKMCDRRQQRQTDDIFLRPAELGKSLVILLLVINSWILWTSARFKVTLRTMGKYYF